ncbi:DUF6119 family protein [Paludibacterium purpuratum]|uniref:Uncharacterized protein (TIGR04141 family) n=1 Tax=Paludibacterium purpuratum TaxID=1144873 RepID=A0A4R7BAJ1_9NEIS|nr:DUF6119 family protein [Paludibacterium purpuratum]TDR80676.1 uncharacterized protein (TIGR04141 family) [Paludibacterium purpuratum]
MISLSIYLIRSSSVKDMEDAFQSFQSTPAKLSEGVEGKFYAMPSVPDEPIWFSTLKPLLENRQPPLELNSQSAGGVLVLKSNPHAFAVSFGLGWLRIKDDWVIPDFGKKAALNAIAPDKLVELSAEQVFAHRHTSNERAPSATNRKVFGVDFDRDLLGTLEGIPVDSKLLGSSIKGGTSFRLRIELSTLESVLNSVGILYESTAYKKFWPEVDNIVRVEDQSIVDNLEIDLHSEIIKSTWPASLLLMNSGSARNSELNAVNFSIGRLERKKKTSSRSGAPYLFLSAWDSWLKKTGQSRSLATAKNTAVHGLDANYEPLFETSIFNCLAFEMSKLDKSGINIQYILSNGHWYRSEQDFIATVNKKLADLSSRLPGKKLSKWDTILHEGDFNLACSKKDGVILFDAKNVSYGGGHSKFEFCDLMDLDNKTLYFVKIAVNSSHMSHLTEQVRRTVELFFGQDPTFRQKLANVVSKHNPSLDVSWAKSRPRNGDWKLCVVPLGKKLAKLPFFAKCGLYRLAKELEIAGHELVCDENP